ncbi:hypothetical protein MHB48_09185 [Psychrobacillus sp. FSL H8-0483]
MKKKSVLLWLCVAVIFSFHMTTNTSNTMEEEGPRPTGIDHSYI